MEPEPRDGVRQGHIIRYNLIVGSRDRGIYLDNYTSNCHVYGNVIVGAKTAAVFVHAGKNNAIENNVIADCGSTLVAGVWIDRFMPAMAGFLSGNRFTQNIVYRCGKTVEVYDVPAAQALSQADENVYFDSPAAAPLSGRPAEDWLGAPFVVGGSAVHRHGRARLPAVARFARLGVRFRANRRGAGSGRGKRSVITFRQARPATQCANHLSSEVSRAARES